MTFGTGINTQHPEQKKPNGEYRDAAVKCWFTSSGKAMPLMLKVRNDREEIVKVENLQVITAEKQWYAGILTWKYCCRAAMHGKKCEFVLLFRPDECSWKIVGHTGD